METGFAWLEVKTGAHSQVTIWNATTVAVTGSVNCLCLHHGLRRPCCGSQSGHHVVASDRLFLQEIGPVEEESLPLNCSGVAVAMTHGAANLNGLAVVNLALSWIGHGSCHGRHHRRAFPG